MLLFVLVLMVIWGYVGNQIFNDTDMGYGPSWLPLSLAPLFFSAMSFSIAACFPSSSPVFCSCACAGDDLKEGDFESIQDSLLSLFVLLTSENYPWIMYPMMHDNKWSFIFFFTFVVLGRLVEECPKGLLCCVPLDHVSFFRLTTDVSVASVFPVNK